MISCSITVQKPWTQAHKDSRWFLLSMFLNLPQESWEQKQALCLLTALVPKVRISAPIKAEAAVGSAWRQKGADKADTLPTIQEQS